jgi:hypothetical protein
MLTNTKNIPLSVAVWLAHDSYDHVSDPSYISATGLLRPTKQVVLGRRVPPEDNIQDAMDLFPSRMGTAIHDSIEVAWKTKYHQALANLGTPKNVIDRVIINPDPADLANHPDCIPVYLEQRRTKEFQGFKIGGKFDIVTDGQLEDFKSTKVWSYQSGSNVEDYILQGSIYRWLNPDKITKDTVQINYILTDWLRSKTLADPEYPKCPIISKQYPLKSLEETEQYIETQLKRIVAYENSKEEDIPECSDDELWRSPSVWKYYKNPETATKPNGRSTKNFDNPAEAYQRQQKDGNVGIVVEKPGQVRRCNYCPGFAICKQKDQYIANGLLTVLD